MTARGRRTTRVTGPPQVDVLVPTYRRPAALAVTLAGLVAQRFRSFRVLVSDQTEDDPPPIEAPEVVAVGRVLEARGNAVRRVRHLPRRGMAEHRQWLLDQAGAPYALFLDDDVLIAPDLLGRLLAALRREGCGFVGSAPIGLSHLADVRPAEQGIDPWKGPVVPERVRPGSPAWARHTLHNAANLEHLRRRVRPTRDVLYRVAWVGGCVLYDVAKLRAAGGFAFWPELPDRHAGEDVLAQLRVMERFGGAGLFPSSAYHLELPTTIPPVDRRTDAPLALDLDASGGPPVTAVAPGAPSRAGLTRARCRRRASAGRRPRTAP